MRKINFLVLCFGHALLHAQTPDLSVQTVSKYNNWGWDAVVMQNGIITIATVPAIGGRVMQYDLGTLPSILVNSDTTLLGKTRTPAKNGNWYNFGGYKTWPAPQSAWNAGGWPPPPTLDYGAYTVDDTTQTNDSVSVVISSSTEQWYAPGVKFERKATMYPGTSRVKMDETIINQGATAVNWSMWSITQSIVNHPNKTDYQNYWAYFPINPNSRYGQSGVFPQGKSNAWKGEVAPGVYGVQFSADNQKIYADPDKGWIAYADRSDTVVFAKTFPIFDGAQYPDSGARVSVYVSGNSPPIYMEIEVKGPMVELAASGGKYEFTENWWAAKVRAPVVDVDSVGAVDARLAYDPITQNLSAIYGVFYEGTAKVVFTDAQGKILYEGAPHTASPLAEFQFQETAAIPNGATMAQIRIYDNNNGFIGTLESANVSQLLTAVVVKAPAVIADYYLLPNYPNPFNGGTVLTFFCPKSAQGSLKIYDLLGKEIATLQAGELSAGEHRYVWNPEHLASGMYIARLEVVGIRQIQKLLRGA
jgi:hypothetical protein